MKVALKEMVLEDKLYPNVVLKTLKQQRIFCFLTACNSLSNGFLKPARKRK